MKTKSLIVTLLVCLISVSLFSSCNKKENNNSSNSIGFVKTDTLWNDHIQGEFFDTQFGASKAELIKNFRKNGLVLNTYASTDNLLHFASSKGKYKTFGGMNWEMVDVNINNNGKFVSITFMNAQDDKASALQNYNGLKSTIEQKYKLTHIEPTDTTLYAADVAYSKTNRALAISCFRYETIGQQIKIGTSLQYIDKSFEEEVSDEL